VLPREGVRRAGQPLHARLLHYYKVELHHLAPNAISQAAIFAAVCEGYLGMEPQWNLWLHLFRVELFAKKAGERGAWCAVHAGSYVLQV
jgi:lysozyme family protein